MSKKDLQEIDALLIFDHWKLGDWAWCLHCQRCYKIGEYRIQKLYGELQMCPYKDCDGDTVMDAIPWRGQGEPVRGKIYDYDHKPTSSN